MTRLLEKGIEAIRSLPADRQDAVGEFLLSSADQSGSPLSPEQIEDLRHSIAEADRKEFASEEAVAAGWKKFGL